MSRLIKVSGILFTCVGILFSSCSQTGGKGGFFGQNANFEKISIATVGAENYRNYVEDVDNGLIISKSVDDVLLEAFYMPISYLALREAETKDINSEQYKTAYTELNSSGLQYVMVNIIVNSKVDPLKYKIKNLAEIEERIKYYSFEVNDDIKLKDGEVELPCVLHHYERGFGITNKITLSLAFPKTANEEDKVLIFDDKIFNKGKLKIKFKKEDFNVLNDQ